ncbi:hypothetical protein [Ulvibacterium sp.]|uniref:hypothetical protein n=1 Tax=Ulvibacterium sp. TaxID=2665914 RepID=UPI003BAD9838
MRGRENIWVVIVLGLFMASCAPVVISSRPNSPPPPWFYPNRLEVVRYVYFPEFSIYYDLSQRTYLYLDGGIWVRRRVLPSRYSRINLRRSRYHRIRNYNDDNIRRYHDRHNTDGRRSTRAKSRTNKGRRN